MGYPDQVYKTFGQGSVPVSVQFLHLSISVGVNVNGVNQKIISPEDGTIQDPYAVVAAAGTRYTGSLVIRGYENEISRGATTNVPTPKFPAGLYIEPTSSQDVSQLALPLSVVRQRIRDGGRITVYLQVPSPVTVANTVQVYRNGVLQSGVTTIPAADGNTWATFDPAAVPAQPQPAYVGSLALTGTVHAVATTGALTENTSSDSTTINWGDGTAAQTIPHGTAITHTYAAAGSYTVKATATVGNLTFPVTVTPNPIVVT